MSNVMIDKFSDTPDIIQVDLGSAFQPYINEPSRSYHYKMKI